jgi:hypothetical protein
MLFISGIVEGEIGDSPSSSFCPSDLRITKIIDFHLNFPSLKLDF